MMIADWRLISDDPPPTDVGLLVSNGTDVTAARWITRSVVVPHLGWGTIGCELDFTPKLWAELPPAPGKDGENDV